MPLRGKSPKRGPRRAPWPGTAQGGSPQKDAGPQGGRGHILRFLAPFRVGAVLWPDEDLPITAAVTIVEDEGTWFLAGARAAPRVQPFIGDDDAWMASIAVDDDYSYVGPYRSWPRIQPFVGDDDAWIASIAVDDDYVILAGYRGYAPARVFVADDDAWIASIGVDDDAPMVVRAAARILSQLVFFDDDGLPVQAAPFGLDEDGWQSRVFVFGPSPRPLAGDEEWVPTIRVDEDGAWIAVPLARALQRSAVLPEEEFIPAVLDEDGWWVVVPRQAFGRQSAISFDEVLALAATLASDPRYIVHLAARPFSDAELAREFEVDLDGRAFTGTAAGRKFATAEGSRNFVVTLKAPRT